RISGPCLTLPFDRSQTSTSAIDASVGIHLHLHYVDLLPEFIHFLRSVEFPFSLYVSVPSPEVLEHVETELRSQLPRAQIVVRHFQNRGRDIAPFLVGFGRELSRHTFICHIHSKRSPHNRNKADWRRQLLVNLLGSGSIVSTILDSFKTNPHLGM